MLNFSKISFPHLTSIFWGNKTSPIWCFFSYQQINSTKVKYVLVLTSLMRHFGFRIFNFLGIMFKSSHFCVYVPHYFTKIFHHSDVDDFKTKVKNYINYFAWLLHICNFATVGKYFWTFCSLPCYIGI